MAIPVSDLNAASFTKRLESISSPEEAAKSLRYFKTGKGEYGEGDVFIGVRMGHIFALSKEFMEMPLTEVEKLLESEIHEVRTGGVCIMDFQARKKKTPETRRKELFDLYIRRHDGINNWDLVDRAAGYVVGSYLYDKPRDILYKLAESENIWERRTAMIATSYFIRMKDTSDAFMLSEKLLGDTHDLIHKAAGWMLRYAGDTDRPKLLAFLDKYATTMPRTMLRYSIEKLSKPEREHYMKLKK